MWVCGRREVLGLSSEYSSDVFRVYMGQLLGSGLQTAVRHWEQRLWSFRIDMKGEALHAVWMAMQPRHEDFSLSRSSGGFWKVLAAACRTTGAGHYCAYL